MLETPVDWTVLPHIIEFMVGVFLFFFGWLSFLFFTVGQWLLKCMATNMYGHGKFRNELVKMHVYRIAQLAHELEGSMFRVTLSVLCMVLGGGIVYLMLI